MKLKDYNNLEIFVNICILLLELRNVVYISLKVDIFIVFSK